MVDYRSRTIWVYDLQSLVKRGMFFSHMGVLVRDSRHNVPTQDMHIVQLMDDSRIDNLSSGEFEEIPRRST